MWSRRCKGTASPASGLRYAAPFGVERGLKVPGREYRHAASLMVLYTVSVGAPVERDSTRMRAAGRSSWSAVIGVVPAGVPLVVYVEQEMGRPLCAVASRRVW
jgi:hypothetical protein